MCVFVMKVRKESILPDFYFLESFLEEELQEQGITINAPILLIPTHC